MTRALPVHQVIGNAVLAAYVVVRTLAGLAWWWVKSSWRERKHGRPQR